MSNILTRDDMIDLFVSVTANTVPSGEEGIFVDKRLLPYLASLELEHVEDRVGNVWVKIGESRTLFTAHMDDVSHKAEPVQHVITNNRWIATDGKTILGADNKAGVLVLFVLMANKVPGNYVFFVGEEIGCKGSGAVAEDYKGQFDRVISFDRKAYGSIITHQSYGRTCSDIFAEALSDMLAEYNSFFEKDDGGIYTDSNSFAPYVSECTNLSVGMYNCHSCSEYIDIYYLTHTIDAVVSIDWESLPAVRDMNISHKRYANRYSDNDWRREYEHGYIGYSPEKRVPRYDSEKNIWVLDDYEAKPAENFLDYSVDAADDDDELSDRCLRCDAVIDVENGSYCSDCYFDYGCDKCHNTNPDFMILTEDYDLYCDDCAIEAVHIDPASDFTVIERKTWNK